MAVKFVSACKNYFGLHPDQKLTDFAKEVRQLSHEDKMEIAAGLRKEGIDCEDPTPPKS